MGNEWRDPPRRSPADSGGSGSVAGSLFAVALVVLGLPVLAVAGAVAWMIVQH